MMASFCFEKKNILQAWGNFDGNFFVIVCVVILSIMCILPYCLFASELTLQLQKISHDAFHSKWYVYPVHLQKYIRWTIIYGQIPRNFDGYNIFKCSLEVFTKVFIDDSSNRRKVPRKTQKFILTFGILFRY